MKDMTKQVAWMNDYGFFLRRTGRTTHTGDHENWEMTLDINAAFVGYKIPHHIRQSLRLKPVPVTVQRIVTLLVEEVECD